MTDGTSVSDRYWSRPVEELLLVLNSDFDGLGSVEATLCLAKVSLPLSDAKEKATALNR